MGTLTLGIALAMNMSTGEIAPKPIGIIEIPVTRQEQAIKPNYVTSPEEKYSFQIMMTTSGNEYQLAKSNIFVMKNVFGTGQDLTSFLVGGEDFRTKQKVGGIGGSWISKGGDWFVEIGGVILFRTENKPDLGGFLGFGYRF